MLHFHSLCGASCVHCPSNKRPNLARTECEVSATLGGSGGTPARVNSGLTEEEDSIASAVVTEYQVDGIAGYTTYRVAVRVGGDASNVYTIYGSNSDHPQDRHRMEVPGAVQTGVTGTTSIGSNIGGVNPAFYAIDATVQYDSWLTVGLTEGLTSNEISTVGIDFAPWNANAGLQITNGAVFWMTPDAGPATNAGKDPVVMQLTILTASSFQGVFNAQGRTRPGSEDGNWDARNIQFHGGQSGGGQAARAPPPPTPTPTPSEGDGCGRDGCGALLTDAGEDATPADADADAAPEDDGGGSSGTIFLVIVALGVVALGAKKKQHDAAGVSGKDGGIYATNIGDSDL